MLQVLTFCNDVVNKSHGESEVDEVFEVVDEAAEGRINRLFFPGVAAVEGDLFAVCDEARVDVPQLALQLLLLRRHAGHLPPQPREDRARQDEVHHHHTGDLRHKYNEMNKINHYTKSPSHITITQGI